MRPTFRRSLLGALVTSMVAATLGLIGAAPAPAAAFSPGNIVVARVGAGDVAIGSPAAPVFLDEFTPDGTLVQSVPLPTASAGNNRRLTVSGSATSEGELTRSADGRYLTVAGYDADPGTAGVVGTTTSAVARVVARVDGTGAVDTSTAITDAFSTSNVRGAATDDGSRFWVSGSTGGVRLAALGSTGSTTQINSAAPVNLRAVAIGGGQLYVSTGSGTTGVYAVGAGLPTVGGQTPALVVPAASPYGIVALDRDPAVPGIDSLYVADDSASGGILKFSFDGSAWTARGSFKPANSSARGLTGTPNGSGTTLFATTSPNTNALVKVDDTAAYDAPISATGTTLRTAAANTVLRGVAFAPNGGGASAPSITTQPQDSTVATGGSATLTVAAGGTGPLGYQWYAGMAGDTTNPVAGATGTSFTTPALTETATYWVRVTGPGGQADSRTATITVAAAPSCSGGVVSIGSVEGTGDISPVAGQTVSVRGTVVGDYEGAQPALRGFYLQDGGDGTASTSDAIFVFDGGANLVAGGDVVQVTGAVSEFQGQTQISASASGVVSCAAQATVTPTDLTLPRATAADLEPYEGMLVRFHETLSVTEHFQLGRFGQVVVSSGGVLRQPTADIRATDQTAVAAAQHANDLNHIIVDDADQAQNPDPIVFGRGGQPLSASNTLRGGDTVTDPVGVLTYTWAGNAASGNAYRLRPLGALGGAAEFVPANQRPTTPPDVGTGGIHVASANLLNFFNTFTGCRLGTLGGVTDCRGAENDQEYQRQLAKEVASLRFLGADVIGYMEMENDGYGQSSAVQALVDALNAVDGPGTWAFVDPDAATGVVDVAGTDAIKAGLLYRAASVTPVAGKTFVDQNALFERRPIAQTFQTSSGGRFTAIANHFKSKGSCPASGPDTDQGDGQSCWNAHRTAQANELASWIGATVVPGAGDPDVLIVGDLNSYAGEDPIAALESAGYVNLVKRFHGQEAYSYVFDGQWGYLDYVLASGSLAAQVTGAGDAHHNADEPAVLDYNTNFKTPGQVGSLYAPDRFRTSDHDPVLAGLNLTTPPVASGTTLAATPNPVATGSTLTLTATVTGPVAPTGTVTFTSTSAGGTATLGSAAVGPSGTAVLAVSTVDAGTLDVVAGYGGDQHLLGSASAPATVSVLDPVTIGAALPNGVVGTSYTASVPHTGGEPATFAAPAGTLPPGLVLSPSGQLSGTPTAGGAFTFTLSATNPVSSATREFTVTIAKAQSSTTLTSSANPATFRAPISFTATVSGPGSVPEGTVQFTVDGKQFGAPVALSAGSATSGPLSALGLGSHQVSVAYSGGPSHLASGATMSQVVWLGVTVVSPTPGARPRSGTIVPIAFQLTDAGGQPISHLAALLLLASGRVTVSATGAQTLPPFPAAYDPFTSRFVLPWPTARRPAGPVTVTVTVTYPGAPTQQVSIPITLT
ncbi:MAG: ExeM/NucH family extracellular endonuclease [Labedaea sp.]